ncbi:GTPase RsgA [Cellulomonas sp. ATA003]|nr:GTPase RsgA [Cellulomonas sp. ATA003]WNB86388.1 GTPase RsgA [Cellulomonas sp. ATA003]
MSPRRPDESDVRIRPGKRSSRPRTKQRPEHADATSAMVTGVDRGRYTLLVDAGGPGERRAIAMKARELGRERVVPGDLVDVVGDTSGEAGSLGRIVRITERTTVLRRTADDTDPVERVIVANADQLVIVTALAEPEPRTRMIDRCVVAGYDAGMDVLLALTKADLADPAELVAMYAPIGVDVVVTRRDPDGRWVGLDDVRRALAGRTSVLVGHSGVGKSTLVNALVPDAHRSVGVVNDTTGRGRHTSTSAVALRMPAGPASGVGSAGTAGAAGADGGVGGDGGTDSEELPGAWVIDTPGCGRSGSRTCRSSTSWRRSVTSRRSPRSARAAARTPTTPRTASSTNGSPPPRTTTCGRHARRAWSPSAGCWPAAPGR